MFCKKGILRNFAKFTRKNCAKVYFSATLLKKRLWHRCFSVNFAKFLRTPFLQNISGRLLLSMQDYFLSEERKFLFDNMKAHNTFLPKQLLWRTDVKKSLIKNSETLVNLISDFSILRRFYCCKIYKTSMNLQLVKNTTKLKCPSFTKSFFIILVLWTDEKCAFKGFLW